jgi:hypothetical protein
VSFRPYINSLIKLPQRHYTFRRFSAFSQGLSNYLILKLFTTNGLNENSKPIWYQEVKSKGTNSDLRTVINYLITGALEHLGQDTKSEIIHTYYSYEENNKKFIQFINTN